MKQLPGLPLYDEFYTHISASIFELMLLAASVQGSDEDCSGVQHIYLWKRIFNSYSKNTTWKIIHLKLRKLIYEEIKSLMYSPNLRSANLLKLCLNELGINLGRKQEYHGEYPTHRWLICWLINNYRTLRIKNSEISKKCLPNSITYNEQGINCAVHLR